MIASIPLEPSKKAVKYIKEMRSPSSSRMKDRVRTNPRTAGNIKKVLTDRVRAFILTTER